MKELVLVEWADANTSRVTMDYRMVEEAGLITAKTVGWLIHENQERLAICGFIFAEGLEQGFRDVHFIPKSWVKCVTKLNIGKSKPSYKTDSGGKDK